MATRAVFPMTGVAHVAQMLDEYMLEQKMAACSNCFALAWDKPLRRCNGCLLAPYCSRECQKDHWPKHRRFCNLVQGKGKKSAYLANLDHDEALRVLVDSYRIRVETDHTHRQEDHGIYYPGKWVDGLVWAKGDATDDFQRYLDLAEESGILPDRWRFEDRMECMSIAVDKDHDASIYKHIDQEQLILQYGGDTTIRNALCILAELVVGYEGQGPAKDDQWFLNFQEHLDLNPQERINLLGDAMGTVKKAFESQGIELPKSSADKEP